YAGGGFLRCRCKTGENITAHRIIQKIVNGQVLNNRLHPFRSRIREQVNSAADIMLRIRQPDAKAFAKYPGVRQQLADLRVRAEYLTIFIQPESFKVK